MIDSPGVAEPTFTDTAVFAETPARSSASRIAASVTESDTLSSVAILSNSRTPRSAAFCDRMHAAHWTAGARPPCVAQTCLGSTAMAPSRESRTGLRWLDTAPRPCVTPSRRPSQTCPISCAAHHVGVMKPAAMLTGVRKYPHNAAQKPSAQLPTASAGAVVPRRRQIFAAAYNGFCPDSLSDSPGRQLK